MQDTRMGQRQGVRKEHGRISRPSRTISRRVQAERVLRIPQVDVALQRFAVDVSRHLEETGRYIDSDGRAQSIDFLDPSMRTGRDRNLVTADTLTNDVVPVTGSEGDLEDSKIKDTGSEVVVNDDQADVDFRVEGDASGHLLFCEAGTDRVGVRKATPTAQLHVDQKGTAAAIPVLHLKQSDDDQDMMELEATIGTGNAIEAVGVKTLTTTHFIKITITGVGDRYIPCGTIA